MLPDRNLVQRMLVFGALLLVLVGCGGNNHDVIIQQPTQLMTEELEYEFIQMMDFDAIRPIYEPEFLQPSQVELLEDDALISENLLEKDDLVLGVAWDGEAKAYPIWVLWTREMVNDELAGIPILVTW